MSDSLQHFHRNAYYTDTQLNNAVKLAWKPLQKQKQ